MEVSSGNLILSSSLWRAWDSPNARATAPILSAVIEGLLEGRGAND